MRKTTSTNTINRQLLESQCGMAHTISLIGGRWKLSILGLLLDYRKLRYRELKTALKGISEKMLSSQLKALEHDNLVVKTVYAQVPPKVEYKLSKRGESLSKILKEMTIWGDANLNKQ